MNQGNERTTSMSKTKGIDKYTLFKLLYEDPSINFEEFFFARR